MVLSKTCIKLLQIKSKASINTLLLTDQSDIYQYADCREFRKCSKPIKKYPYKPDYTLRNGKLYSMLFRLLNNTPNCGVARPANPRSQTYFELSMTYLVCRAEVSTLSIVELLHPMHSFILSTMAVTNQLASVNYSDTYLYV